MLTKFNEYIRCEHMFAKQLFEICKPGAGSARNSNTGMVIGQRQMVNDSKTPIKSDIIGFANDT